MSTAAPTAFGFLNNSVGDITIDGASLELMAGKTLSLVGSNIELNNGSITSKSGQINLVSVNSSGNAVFEDAGAGFETNGFTGFGDIVLDGFNLDVSGDLGGGMFVPIGFKTSERTSVAFGIYRELCRQRN